MQETMMYFQQMASAENQGVPVDWKAVAGNMYSQLQRVAQAEQLAKAQDTVTPAKPKPKIGPSKKK